MSLMNTSARRPSRLPRASGAPAPHPGRRPAGPALTLTLNLALACLVGAPTGAIAQLDPAGAIVQVQLASQPLGQALTELARQTGTTLIAQPALLEGKVAQAVVGELTIRQAYERLLAGTGLEAQVEGGVVTIQSRPTAPAGPAGAARALPAVTVVGSTINPTTTEGTQSYTTQATRASTGLELAPREIPQSVTVMTRQRMDDQGLTQLTDVANQAPGLHLSQGGNVGSDSAPIYSRGFEVDNYLLDGVKMLNSYSSIFQSQDTALYDRIEIVRGATGLMNGSGSPAAAINLVRKMPTRDFQGKVGLTLGSWAHRRLDLDVSSPINESGSVRGRVVAALQDSASYIGRLEEDRKVLYGVVEADLSPSTVVRAGASQQRHDSTGHARGGMPAFWADGTRADWSRSASAAASWAYSKRHSTTLFAEAEHSFNADWRVKASLMQIRTDSDELVGYLGGNPDRVTGAGARIWATHWVYTPTQNVINLTANGRFDLFGRRHELATGISLARSKQDRDPAFTNWNHAGWDAFIPNVFEWDGSLPAAPPNPAVGWGTSTESNYGAFASLRLRPTEALSVILGTRVTDWRSRNESYRFATGATTVTDRKETGEVIPYAGVTYDLTSNWTVYTSYTNIFEPQNNKGVSGLTLDPLKGNSTEFGVKGAFYDNRLNLAAAIYEIQQDNLAVAIPDVFAPDGSQAYEAMSGTKSRGFEFEATGQIRPGWEIAAGLSRNFVRDREKEPLLTEIPKTTFKLFSSVELPSVGNGLTIGGGVRWQGKSYRNNMGPSSVRFGVPSYSVAELMARYRLNRSMTASLHLFNALDKVYLTAVSNSYYGAPRYVRAGLEVTF